MLGLPHGLSWEETGAAPHFNDANAQLDFFIPGITIL